jgi:hypothetical protein
MNVRVSKDDAGTACVFNGELGFAVVACYAAFDVVSDKGAHVLK